MNLQDLIQCFTAVLFSPRDLPPKLHVIMNGLDSAGKTTILYHLAHHVDGAAIQDVIMPKKRHCPVNVPIQDVMPKRHCPVNNYYTKRITTTIPTIGFNVEHLQHKARMSRLEVVSWDVGGPDKIRPLWRHYYMVAEAYCFVIDSNDHERIESAVDELYRTTQEFACNLKRKVPILILANKQDLPNALELEEVVEKYRLHFLSRMGLSWRLQGMATIRMASGRRHHPGLHEGFNWLVHGGLSPAAELIRNAVLLQQGRASIVVANGAVVGDVVADTCRQLPMELVSIIAGYLGGGSVCGISSDPGFAF